MVIVQEPTTGRCTIITDTGMISVCNGNLTLQKKSEFCELPVDERINVVYRKFNIAKNGNEICKAAREGTVTLKIDRSIQGIKMKMDFHSRTKLVT